MGGAVQFSEYFSFSVLGRKLTACDDDGAGYAAISYPQPSPKTLSFNERRAIAHEFRLKAILGAIEPYAEVLKFEYVPAERVLRLVGTLLGTEDDLRQQAAPPRGLLLKPDALLRPAYHFKNIRGQIVIRFEVDSDRAYPAGQPRKNGGTMIIRMRNTARDTFRPDRQAVLSGRDRDGISPQFLKTELCAMPPGSELSHPSGHGAFETDPLIGKQLWKRSSQFRFMYGQAVSDQPVKIPGHRLEAPRLCLFSTVRNERFHLFAARHRSDCAKTER